MIVQPGFYFVFHFFAHKPLIKLETIDWRALKWFPSSKHTWQNYRLNAKLLLRSISTRFFFSHWLRSSEQETRFFFWFGKNDVEDHWSKFKVNKKDIKIIFRPFFERLQCVDTLEPRPCGTFYIYIQSVRSRRWLIDLVRSVKCLRFLRLLLQWNHYYRFHPLVFELNCGRFNKKTAIIFPSTNSNETIFSQSKL